jgi:hypothetical protein
MYIKILTGAINDLNDAYQFYEKQYSGLGVRFLDSLFFEIDSLKEYHGIHQICFKKYY